MKYYRDPKWGFKAGVRWTPTNLGETADEWLCSPFPGGCVASGSDTQYSNQLEFAAGVLLRF